MTEMFPKDQLLATMRCRRGALLPCKLDWPITRVCYWSGHARDLRPAGAGATTWQDAWNVTWHKESPDPAMSPFPVDHPLGPGLVNLHEFKWPDPNDRQLFADLRNVRHDMGHLLVGEHPYALYDRAWLLCGMQNLLQTMEEDPGRVDELFGRIADFQLTVARHYLELGIEAVWIGDDYGMHSGLGFTADMWRRFVLPHLRTLVAFYADAGLPVILHTGGNVTPLIDDFLDVGINVLDPLQPDCNDLDEIRHRTQGRMCLCGGIGSTTMMSGDSGRVAMETHRRVAQLGAMGGYIVGPDAGHEYPSATREAMLNAVFHYREKARGRD